MRSWSLRVLIGAVMFFMGTSCLRKGDRAWPRQLSPVYRFRLYHMHTNERIDSVYPRGDTYLPEATDRLNRFLRDHRTPAPPPAGSDQRLILFADIARRGVVNFCDRTAAVLPYTVRTCKPRLSTSVYQEVQPRDSAMLRWLFPVVEWDTTRNRFLFM